MIRLATFALILMAMGSAWAGPRVNDPKFMEPPYWMPSYDEVIDFDAEQKHFFLSEMQILVGPSELPKVSNTELAEASEWAESWDALRVRVSKRCDDGGSVKRTCAHLADLRVETLLMRQNDRIENRIQKAREDDIRAKRRAARAGGK